MLGQDLVGRSERVFTVSEGEAVNSPGLIESWCCGFGLIRPPPPPPLDNVSLKPLCKLTAFLRAEHQGSRQATATMGAHVLRGRFAATGSAPPHLSCPGPGPSPGLEKGTTAVKRTDPLITRNLDGTARGGGMQ